MCSTRSCGTATSRKRLSTTSYDACVCWSTKTSMLTRRGRCLHLLGCPGIPRSLYFHFSIADEHVVFFASSFSGREVAGPIAEVGCEALNANLQSKVDAFDFCSFEDAERGDEIQEVGRHQHGVMNPASRIPWLATRHLYPRHCPIAP